MPHSSTSQTQQLPAEDTIDLQKALLLFWRGKFLVLLFALVGIVFGLYYIYFLATPTYRSSAVLMLDTRQEQVVNLESVISGVGSDQVAINTEVEVLQSRVLLGLVVDELQLTKDPEFNPSLLPPPALTKFKLSGSENPRIACKRKQSSG